MGGSVWWTSDEQSGAELRRGKGEKHHSPFQSSSDASWVFLMRLFKILETFRGRLLGFIGNIRVVDCPDFALGEREMFIRGGELDYPFKPAATFFGSLSGIASADPERTSMECCLDSSDVSGDIRKGDVTAARVIYWDC